MLGSLAAMVAALALCDADEARVRKSVDVFLAAELAADPARLERVRYTPEALRGTEEAEGSGDGRFGCERDAFVVVEGCRVVELHRRGTFWSADVSCRRVGHAGARLDAMSVESPREETLSYAVTRSGGEWRVTDPPEARVSLSAIRACIEKALSRSGAPPDADGGVTPEMPRTRLEHALAQLAKMEARAGRNAAVTP